MLFLLSMTILVAAAETNTTSETHFEATKAKKAAATTDLLKSDTNNSLADQNRTISTEANSTKSKNIQSTMDLLVGYDSVTAAGVLKSEPDVPDENLSQKENNTTNLIGPTTKLDDVSSLDIVKEQRKQRKKEREKEKKTPEKKKKVSQLIDTIVVKGSVLQGQIDQLTSEYISFKLIYGEGSIRIDYSDVETLSTEHKYHIYFDGKETQGYITSIEDHAFLKVKHGKIEELVTISKIDRFIISEDEDTSLENRLRNTFPYWSGNMDIGMEFEEGSSTKNKFKVAGHVERKRAEFKTIFDVTYGYETTKTIGTPEVLNKHELYSFLEQDFSFRDNDLLFAEVGYDFDVPRYVDNRVYPSAGYGYRLQDEKKRWIQFKVGMGFVYEEFLGISELNTTASTNHYLAGMFGIDGEYEVKDLPLLNRIILGANLFYMPGIKDVKDNWLLRYSINAAIPLSKTLSLRMIARQITDDNPAPEVGNNKFTFDMYISLRF